MKVTLALKDKNVDPNFLPGSVIFDANPLFKYFDFL